MVSGIEPREIGKDYLTYMTGISALTVGDIIARHLDSAVTRKKGSIVTKHVMTYQTFNLWAICIPSLLNEAGAALLMDVGLESKYAVGLVCSSSALIGAIPEYYKLRGDWNCVKHGLPFNATVNRAFTISTARIFGPLHAVRPELLDLVLVDLFRKESIGSVNMLMAGVAGLVEGYSRSMVYHQFTIKPANVLGLMTAFAVRNISLGIIVNKVGLFCGK